MATRTATPWSHGPIASLGPSWRARADQNQKRCLKGIIDIGVVGQHAAGRHPVPSGHAATPAPSKATSSRSSRYRSSSCHSDRPDDRLTSDNAIQVRSREPMIAH